MDSGVRLRLSAFVKRKELCWWTLNLSVITGQKLAASFERALTAQCGRTARGQSALTSENNVTDS